ncbi:vacuolar protein sorting 36 isoform X2 [Bombus fervidus]|uniref:vacuolar protein sorting 36 isoform X2 n=1 Tax=Bombus fervidus TaxID=203811 RepID=UPI003AB5D1E1
MNRFEYADSRLLPNEIYIRRDVSICIYDGDIKTNFESGELVLTSHRFLWGRPGDISRGHTCLSLSLRHIVFFEEEIPGPFSFGRSKKVVIHLSEAPIDKMPGPLDNSVCNYIKFSFKEGLDPNFHTHLSDAIMRRIWEFTPIVPLEHPDSNTKNNRDINKPLPQIKTRTGIIGIERSLQEQQKATDESISMAFQDLKKLMEVAKDMVSISKTISAKIRERQGDITEDETEVGGMITLTDVYCRVNRARGLELLSPEDLLNASRQLASLGLPIVLRVFDSGVMVLQSRSHDDNVIVDVIADLIKEKGSLTAEELAQSEGISVLLARERLLVTEKRGKACRDDTIEALRFYPNLFLENND